MSCGNVIFCHRDNQISESMKRIIIICEGPTEREFCNTVLAPYLAPKGIYLNAPLIKHSHGGIVPCPLLQQQIDIHLRAEHTAYVTTLIDYYGLADRHHFPMWEASRHLAQVAEAVTMIEQGMLNAIDESMRPRFIPYIQLHEFEGLLFSSIDVFEKVIPHDDLMGTGELKQIAEGFDNPEMINNSRETSPSHRLERIIRGYDKVVYGNYIAEAIGINRICERCPRFNSWVERLTAVKDLA